MKIPLRLLIAMVASTVLLAGCAGTGSGTPSDKSAQSATPTASESSASSPSPFQDTSSDATEEPTDEPADDPVADFNQSYTYSDGVDIEVTKIKHGEVSNADAEVADMKAGSDYVEMTVKVTNGSDNNIRDLSSSQTVTFGPDGDEATEVYLSSSNRNYASIGGTLRPEKSKVALVRVAIPNKYQDDVQLEFSFDGDHETAVFAGSVE